MTKEQQQIAERWAFRNFALEILATTNTLTEAETTMISFVRNVQNIRVGRLQQSIYIPEQNTLILEMSDGDTEFQIYVTMESVNKKDPFDKDALYFKFKYCLSLDHEAFFDEDDIVHWTVVLLIDELKALGVI